MKRLLFVCHGNICRSAAAKVVFEEMARRAGASERFDADSAATSTEELGNDIYPPMKRALIDRGYACGPHRARQATRTDCERADHILCADFANVRNMRRIAGEKNSGKVSLLLSWAGRKDEVADPWYTRDFEAALDDIEEGCSALLKTLMNGDQQ